MPDTAKSSGKPDSEELARKLFKKLDINGDGAVSLSEFARYVVKSKIAEDHAEARFMFRYADANHDGKLSVAEIRKCFVEADEPDDELREDNLEALFFALDADGNGSLDFSEVMRAFKVWGQQFVLSPACPFAPLSLRVQDVDEAVVRRDWKQIDTDGNGVIDYDEFKYLLAHHSSASGSTIFVKAGRGKEAKKREKKLGGEKKEHSKTTKKGRVKKTKAAKKGGKRK